MHSKRAHIRRASDCLVTPASAPGELHRAVHAAVIDYRLQEITGEAARGFSTTPGAFADKPAFRSPWHYHDCDLQVAIVLAGSVELAFADGGFSRLSKGAVMFIPGHVIHDVSTLSADYQVAEFIFPGYFATIEASAPAPKTPTLARLWGTHDAVRSGCTRGLIGYRYPVGAPYSDRYHLELERHSRSEPFEPGALRHTDRLQLLFVTLGFRDVTIEGETTRLGIGDVLVIPAGADCAEVSVSEEHEAMRISVRR
jgi:quercetin dioxygenase-like cupin family protein